MTQPARISAPTSPTDESSHDRGDADDASLLERYRRVREQTGRLCAPLLVEDYTVQSMPDASPTKWHIAHTTWFFETFVLENAAPGRKSFHPKFGYLFNSYYNAVGERHARPRRGMLTRPTVDEVWDYRSAIDGEMETVLGADVPDDLAAIIETGLHHEQQHQELLLTDIKHTFSCNPMLPAYATGETVSGNGRPPAPVSSSPEFIEFPGGLAEAGHDGSGFCFDNELPRHQVLLHPFQLADRLITNGEYCEFIEDGGYRDPQLWLSDGWDVVQREEWTAPLYWQSVEGRWETFTLHGLRPVADDEPVCHISYYEADAFARWSQARLPTEFEWELVASAVGRDGNFVEAEQWHPRPAPSEQSGVRQLFGDVWEWTSSPYVAYPGFQPAAGALGEYNGKFMCNQWVLRGGSCATPASHIRSTYRNFFPPHARWQFSGLRLARDGGSR